MKRKITDLAREMPLAGNTASVFPAASAALASRSRSDRSASEPKPAPACVQKCRRDVDR